MNGFPPIPAPASRTLWLTRLFLALGIGLAYHGSLDGPLVFDDTLAIVDNQSIRQLSRLGAVLAPDIEGGATVSGRPLLNLSLAINYAIGGVSVTGYHVVNILIHLLAAFVLCAIIRRTLRRPAMNQEFGPASLQLALMVAGIWALHPLQTSAVTYTVQRAESLMGLCYLTTIYGFIRATSSSRPRSWLALSATACLAGMATKESMASAPLIVFLYDRTFVGGSFAAAWRARRSYYACLASTWILLAILVAGTGGRGGTAGFGTELSVWHYALTQCDALVRYLGLAVWPGKLVFDYGMGHINAFSEVWLQAGLIVAALATTCVALRRRPGAGFLGAAFFALLAPSSSFVPVTSQTVAEHRMYLALAPLVAVGAVLLYRWIGRRTWLVGATIACACGGATIARNADYGSELRLWTDTAVKWPGNPRAYNNLAKAYLHAGQPDVSERHLRTSLQLKPTAAEPHYNLGLALARLNRPVEAIVAYQDALRLQPRYPAAHNNLGTTLLAAGRSAEALLHYEAAIRLKPDFAQAHSNAAHALLESGRPAEALGHAEKAVRLDPNNAEAHYNLGNVHARSDRLAAATASYQIALRLKPNHANAHNNLGNVLLEMDRLPEAIPHYEAALSIEPNNFDPRRNLALALLYLGRGPAALPHLRLLQRQRPDDREIRDALARLTTEGVR